MPYGNPLDLIFASARDIGNVGAGMEAGRHGMKWRDARLGFDGLQSFQDTKNNRWIPVFSKEGQTTQYAERLGWIRGVNQWTKEHPILSLISYPTSE